MSKPLLALVAAAAVATAGQAGATIVQADFSGTYWVVGAPNGWAEAKYDLPPNYRQGGIEIFNGAASETVNFVIGGVPWTASFVFDTTQGVLTEHPFGGLGGTFESLAASPILSGSFSAPGFPFSQDLTGGLLSMTFGPGGLWFSISDGYVISANMEASQQPPPVQDHYSLSNPLFLARMNFPYFIDAGLLLQDGAFSAQQGAVNFGRLTPLAPVPEPGAWALIILGIAGIGAALRRQPREVYSPIG